MGNEIKTFRDLIAWQKAMTLCRRVYELTGRFPDTERFGLIAQLRRSAVSVPSNIAEGYGRRRKQDYVRFLDVAYGSLCEVETQLILSCELELAPAAKVAECVSVLREVDRVLSALTRAVAASDAIQRGSAKV